MHQALETDPRPGVFRPFAQNPLASATFAVRAVGDPLQLVHAISGQVRAIDPDQPVSAFDTMDDLMEAEGGQRRVILMLLGCFAGTALLLAIVGLYGVISYSVAQRTKELGIRCALGAQRSDILSLVIGQGFGLSLAGVLLGVCAALALTRVLKGLLFQVRSTDPVTFVGISMLSFWSR